MKQRQRSKTAEVTAAVRAWNTLYGDPEVFEDRFAIQLTSLCWRTIARNRTLSWVVVEKILKPIRPFTTVILGRARYAEELLEVAIENGVDQYVILSAGLDSFALRRKDLIGTLKIYELDHPATQERKKKRMAKLKIDVPDNLEFVPIDFEKESLADGLARCSYSSERRTFFSWLGTIQYLTRDAIFDTLESVASIAAPGSEIVFDYMIPTELVEPKDRPAVEAVTRFVERRGEPLVSKFDPSALSEEVSRLGFELAGHVSPEQLMERYFIGRNYNFSASPNMCLAHFRLGRRGSPSERGDSKNEGN